MDHQGRAPEVRGSQEGASSHLTARYVCTHEALPRACRYAWHLAEGFAKAAMIDAVRVDVFLHPGHPELAMINEISLTTGHFYNAHHHYMAQAWQQGHQAKEYETVDLGRSTHLHFRGPDWFARNYSNCDASVLHPKLLEMWC